MQKIPAGFAGIYKAERCCMTGIFKTDMEEAVERVEAWWEGLAVSRPAIQITAPKHIGKPVVPEKTPSNIHDFWTEPEVVIPRIFNQMAGTWFGGEAFPVVFPVSGKFVAITSRFLGAENHYIDTTTTWAEPINSSYEELVPSLVYTPGNYWWNIAEKLLKRASAFITQNELTCFLGNPDLNGPTEILSELRGQEQFCLDFYDFPQWIKPAIEQVQSVWLEYWKRCTAITHPHGGYFTWMKIWSEKKAVDIQSDVSCLLSKDQFDEYLLPSLVNQIEAFDRTVYHLDGPQAVRHLDSLLEIPGLTAIQWVQGAGGGKVTEWIPLLQRIQENGKPVYLYCEPEEVEMLAKKLSHQGLMLVTQCSSEAQGREILSALNR